MQRRRERFGRSAGSKTYKIGVLQLTEHGALDAANKGFVSALDDSGMEMATSTSQNTQNDQSACQTIATKLVNDGDDLILAIATPPQGRRGRHDRTSPSWGRRSPTAAAPAWWTATTKPVTAPGTDLISHDDQFSLLVKSCSRRHKTAGILYCTAESATGRPR